jgi:hypothetical protein
MSNRYGRAALWGRKAKGRTTVKKAPAVVPPPKKVICLRDLPTKSVYEYVYKDKSWNRSVYAVMYSGSYVFHGQHKEGYVFVADIKTGKVCHHRGELAVLFIDDKKKKVEVSMDHFVGWKFGVPVKISGKDNNPDEREQLLIFENGQYFKVLNKLGHITVFRKASHYYRPIPFCVPDTTLYPRRPRYPVCQTPSTTASCNNVGIMEGLATTVPLEKIPAATLNIEGREIELSDETVAELKEQLGI